MVRPRSALALVVVLTALVALAPGPSGAAVAGEGPPQSTGDCDHPPGQVDGRAWDVRLVYIHALERCPSDDEVAYWVGRQEGGMTRLQLAESVDRSTESLDQIVAETFARAGLERAATDQERAALHGSLRATRSSTGLMVTVMASEEFLEANDLDVGQPEQWVEAVFPRLLGRAADEAAVAHFTSAHDLGTVVGRSRVTTIIVRSAELRRLWITQSYAAILGRQPDARGLAHWDGWLRAGRGFDRTLQLRSMILASGEAHALATCPVTC